MTVIYAYQVECDDDDLVYRKSDVDKIIENLRNSHKAAMTDLGMENHKLKEQIRKYKMMRAFYNADVCMKKSAGANSEKKLMKWLNRYERWIEIADKLKE